MTSFAKRDATFSKFDDEHRIAYGWAMVSEENGKPYFDLQGDHIPMGPIIEASIDFMKNSRASDDMHREQPTGTVVFCAPVTKGTVVDPAHPNRTGLWIGAQIHDDEVYEKTKRGERAGFSIGGFLDEAEYLDQTGKMVAVGKRFNLTHVSLDEFATLDRDYLAKREKAAKGRKPQRIFRSFRLGFISTVDLPAQEGALIQLVKGAPKEALLWIAKGVVLTSEEDGHQHIVDPSCWSADGSGRTGSAQVPSKDGYGGYHSHDMVRGEDGAIIIASNAGHGHTVDAVAIDPPPAASAVENVTADYSSKGKNPFADDSTDEDKKKKAEAENDKKKPGYKNPNKALVPGTESALEGKHKEIKMETIQISTTEHASLLKFKERVEHAEQTASLTDAQKTYIGKLSPDGQKAFLAKSAVERDTELKAQIEYTSPITGDVYYKFDDSRLVKNAKRADESETTSKANAALAKRATFAKTASEVLKGYPGTDDVHTDIIAAVEMMITDADVKKAALEALNAGSAALLTKSSVGGYKGPVGKGANNETSTPIEKARNDLRVAVEEYQKARSIPSYEIAFMQATGSDQKIRELYEAVSDLAS